jgi:glutaredoxin
MLTSCPHCHTALQFTEGQMAKIQASLDALQEGKVLKLGCPHCKKAISIDRKGNPVTDKAALYSGPASHVEPPAPPDLSWLSSSEFEAREVVEDVPQVLVLVSDEGLRQVIGDTFSDLGYLPVSVQNVETAMDKMRFESFKAVVYHTSFEGKPLSEASFHQFMSTMAMSSRRYIYYVLVGPELHTLYDLEALGLSANLVVNDRETPKMDFVLRKGLTDYEALFGPFLSAMREYGKR